MNNLGSIDTNVAYWTIRQAVLEIAPGGPIFKALVLSRE